MAENSYRRASLNSLTSLFDFGAKVLTSFILNPILVNGLGSAMFGIWQVLAQLTAYSGVLDFKSGEVLKWSIAKDREAKESSELNRHYSAAIYFQWIVSPIILIVGGSIALFAPKFIGVSDEYKSIVSYSILFLILGLVIDKFFNLFESVLRGMNLGYKRMGLRAMIFVFGGLLQYLAVINGNGILGLAAVNVLTAIISGIILYVIVKKSFPWIKLLNFDRTLLKDYSIKTGWFSLWALVNVLLSQSDKIFLLKLSSPEMVSKLVMTFYLIVAARGVVSQVMHGVMPGIGKYIGLDKFDELLELRKRISILGFGFVFIFSALVIGFNETFVKFWVGVDLYAGLSVTALLTFNFVQNFFIARDNVIINMFLDVKGKVKVGLIVWMVEVVIWIVLIPKLGILGLLVGSVIGKFIMMIYFPILLGKMTGRKVDNLLLDKKTILFSLIALSLGLTLNYVCTFFSLGVGAIVLFFVALTLLSLIAYYGWFSGTERKAVKKLVGSVLTRIK